MQLRKKRQIQFEERPGFCIDTGASLSVIGIKELHRVWSRMKRRLPELKKSNSRFRFADASFKSLGRAKLPLQTLKHVFPILVVLEVVPADSQRY